MVNQLLIIGGSIFALMGILHGLVAVIDVFRPRQFTPVDDSVQLAMKSTNVRFLKARASMWDAWLGFNISHSLGLFVFGGAIVWLGLSIAHIEIAKSVLFIPVVIGLIYFFLSVRFWFYAPTLASAVATACFFTAWWIF
jgi:hypothetical protein